MFCLEDELEVRAAENLGQLEDLRSDWENLWQVCEHATPFQSPGWLLPWWRHLGEGELLCLSFWRGQMLCGLAPFYIYARPEDGERQLLLLGSGNSDYLDVLTRPGHEQGVLKQLASGLMASRSRWDIAEFLQLRPASPLMELAPSTTEGLFFSEITSQDCCPVLRLPRAPQDHWTFFQRPCFTRLDYYWRRAGREGAIQVERSELCSLDAGVDALIHFENQRWSARGLESVLAKPAVQRFHRVACYHLCAAGLLRFYTLKLDDRIIAAFYGFQHRERFYFYLGGFDDQYSKLSPGKLILAHAIEQAVLEGAKAFDFLRGQEAYKYDWGAEDTPAFRRALWINHREGVYEQSAGHHRSQCL